MESKRIGEQTVAMLRPPVIINAAAIAGQKEGEGPLRDSFDAILSDDKLGQKSWELAESELQKRTAQLALDKSGLSNSDIDYILAGDLLNQCIGASYGLRDLNIPFLGMYGACSTMAESLSVGSMMIDGGFADKLMCLTSSHFCSAEKQFRYPLEYGGQRPPSAQWTVTGSGCAILSSEGDGPKITHITTGKIIDMGVTDANNMGAAMAPAAADTLTAHFKELNIQPSEYDLILTGDLGVVGSDILIRLMNDNGFNIAGIHNDCGKLIFDVKAQDVHSGASGCGCCGTVFCGHVYKLIKEKKLNKVLFVATGALMNSMSVQQGESIPSIAHAVSVSAY